MELLQTLGIGGLDGMGGGWGWSEEEAETGADFMLL